MFLLRELMVCASHQEHFHYLPVGHSLGEIPPSTPCQGQKGHVPLLPLLCSGCISVSFTLWTLRLDYTVHSEPFPPEGV